MPERVLARAVPMRTIDPSDEDFSDLEAFAEIVGDARVVQLGEQCHGDGATFHAKTRLIKFLHQRLGFDVLVWESGLYDCRVAWEAFRSGVDPMDAARLGIFDTWRSEQVRPMFDYLARHASGDHPLELAGYDCQFSGRASKQQLVADLTKRVGPEPAEFVRCVIAGEELDVAAETKAIGALEASSASESDPFWAQCLRSVAANLKAGRLRREQDVEAYSQARDLQMGENTVWLANELYAERRIAVWADTGHISNGFAALDLQVGPAATNPELAKAVEQMQKYRTQGGVTREALGDDLLTICTAAARGSVGRSDGPPATLGTIPMRELDEPPPDSFEALFLEAGLENAIVDLRPRPGDSWTTDPRVARFLAYTWRLGTWTEFADLVLFTADMFPSVRYDVPAGV